MKEEKLEEGLKMGRSLLNRIGNPLIIPKPLICIEPKNMNGFEELFFPLLPHSLDQSQRKEKKNGKRLKQAFVPLVIDRRESGLVSSIKVIQ